MPPEERKSIFKILNTEVYRFCGPTTLHLKYEILLLIAITFLTTASFGVLYEHTLNFNLILMISLWQCRYLLLRLVCTTRNFNFLGLRSIVCKLCVAGQYFDASRPPLDYTRPQFLVMNNSFFQNLLGIGGGQLGSSSGSKGGGKRKDDQSQMKTLKLDKYMRQNAYNYVISKYNEYVPPGLISAQFCATLAVVLFLSYVMLENVSFHPYRRALLSQVHPMQNKSPENYGAIQTLIDSFEFDYSNVSVTWFFYFLVSVSTLLSVFIFGRLIPPIPDLVAGTSVIKALRNQAKQIGKIPSKSKKDEEILWAEQYRSIVVENRLRLSCHVIIFRLIENLFFVAFLPVTELTCIVSGVCHPGPQVWERIGIPGVGLKPDPSMFFFIGKHNMLSNLIALATAIVTVSLLVAQTITLDKTYLAFLCQCSDMDSMENSRRNSNGYRKIRKSDAGLQNKVDSLDCGNMEYYKHKFCSLLSEEIGPQETSKIILFLSQLMSFLIAVVFVSSIMAYYYSYKCFSFSMISIAVAASGRGVVDFGLVSFNELNIISDEITQQYKQKHQTYDQ